MEIPKLDGIFPKNGSCDYVILDSRNTHFFFALLMHMFSLHVFGSSLNENSKSYRSSW
jgi:hypothetical protein